MNSPERQVIETGGWQEVAEDLHVSTDGKGVVLVVYRNKRGNLCWSARNGRVQYSGRAFSISDAKASAEAGRPMPSKRTTEYIRPIKRQKSRSKAHWGGRNHPLPKAWPEYRGKPRDLQGHGSLEGLAYELRMKKLGHRA